MRISKRGPRISERRWTVVDSLVWSILSVVAVVSLTATFVVDTSDDECAAEKAQTKAAFDEIEDGFSESEDDLAEIETDLQIVQTQVMVEQTAQRVVDVIQQQPPEVMTDEVENPDHRPER